VRDGQQLLSPEGSLTSSSPPKQSKDIQSLSFIIHPSHESCSPEQRNDATPLSEPTGGKENILALCCYSLGVNPNHLDRL